MTKPTRDMEIALLIALWMLSGIGRAGRICIEALGWIVLICWVAGAADLLDFHLFIKVFP